jgi:nucleoside-diphosphate-sugar epimerase
VFTAGAGLAGAAAFPGSSRAAAISTSGARVLVAGASGQTGSRVLSQLLGSYPALTTVAGVRTPSKVKSTAVKLDLEDPSTFAVSAHLV